MAESAMPSRPSGAHFSRRHCPQCFGSGKVSRPKTVDHILTDTVPWQHCPTCGGAGKSNVQSIASDDRYGR